MRRVEANLVDEDEVELKNFCHSTKKFLLRYVVSVSAIMNLYGVVWLHVGILVWFAALQYCVWNIFSFHLHSLHVGNLVCFKLDYTDNWSPLFAVHFGWDFTASPARQISSSQEDYWGRSSSPLGQKSNEKLRVIFIMRNEDPKFNTINSFIFQRGFCIAQSTEICINLLCILTILPVCRSFNLLIHHLLSKVSIHLLATYLENLKVIHQCLSIALVFTSGNNIRYRREAQLFDFSFECENVCEYWKLIYCVFLFSLPPGQWSTLWHMWWTLTSSSSDTSRD